MQQGGGIDDVLEREACATGHSGLRVARADDISSGPAGAAARAASTATLSA